MSRYPLVSIITPSYNQAQFIRYTLDSILNQDYPNLECIVIDGGSTDDTISILEYYRQKDRRFTYVSERDRGQSHAINKGIAMAKGDIIGWLNSDDTYLPGAVRKAVHALHTHPHWSMVYGNANVINERNAFVHSFDVQPYDLRTMFEICSICQPAAFLRKQTLIDVGGIDESYDFCMDYNLWIRIGKQHLIGYINELWANHRIHQEAKGHTQFGTVGITEIFRTSKAFYGAISNTWIHYYVMFHREQGAVGLVHHLKKDDIFGTSPAIQYANVKANCPVPDRWYFHIQHDQENPLHAFAIHGHNDAEARTCHVVLSGDHVSSFTIPQGKFELVIPIVSLPIVSDKPTISLEIHVSSSPSSTSDLSIRDNTFLEPSLQLSHFVPLSAREAAFYDAFTIHPFGIDKWLQQHRKVTPHY
ncbi:glycosyltransferase family 2 protein [Paenibacillus sp. 481]|uniref:glycosyltransferase family 2 protein n=1 Tax=Paenibacillus sp. 481 TaxID=2835869 RepID=UPI001E345379|nr:glycosyltransferase family 2 protein [Paenibacillus sp. 481]UHA73156.1 glycosyltransferase [Paenibacillus sp. 481]